MFPDIHFIRQTCQSQLGELSKKRRISYSEADHKGGLDHKQMLRFCPIFSLKFYLIVRGLKNAFFMPFVYYPLQERAQ